MRASHTTKRQIVGAVSLLALAAAFAGCSEDGDGGDGADDEVAVTLITKDSINPFFVSMQEGAEKAAKAEDVDLTVAAGKEDGDEDGQIQAIENAVAQGQDGILITPNGPGVNPAIENARDSGLYVIALDTPPDPADTVDITFATDNFKAGALIGEWTAAQLGGEKATIALLDLFNDKVVSVDYNRDQGFLTGMGIDTGDAEKNGDEATTGSYSGGDYEIVCNEPTDGAEDGGRTAMETCLSGTDGINVVYTINEPAAYGARPRAGLRLTDALIVSVDGGCRACPLSPTESSTPPRSSTRSTWPKRVWRRSPQIANGGEKPETTEGLDFFDTGVKLVTDTPADGVESIDSAGRSEICWG